MCMNKKVKKVLIGIGLAMGGLFLVNPAWGAVALPLLFFALCPLMMFVMMRGMGGMGGSTSSGEEPNGERSEGSTAALSADERIASLQAQVRELKAAQAASDAEVTEQSPSSKKV